MMDLRMELEPECLFTSNLEGTYLYVTGTGDDTDNFQEALRWYHHETSRPAIPC